MSVKLYFLDSGWNSEPNKFNPTTGNRDAKPPSQFAEGPYWLIKRDEDVEDYVDYLMSWLKKKKLRLNRLLLAGHGNAGELHLGTGLLQNAGVLQPLRQWFADQPGSERTVRIHGCGIASSTPGIKFLQKDPRRTNRTSYDEHGVPTVMITDNPNFDILMIQGKFTASGQGMAFLNAIAECTGGVSSGGSPYG